MVISFNDHKHNHKDKDSLITIVIVKTVADDGKGRCQGREWVHSAVNANQLVYGQK